MNGGALNGCCACFDQTQEKGALNMLSHCVTTLAGNLAKSNVSLEAHSFVTIKPTASDTSVSALCYFLRDTCAFTVT